MYKNHSIPLNKLYLGELIAVGICVTVIIGIVVSKTLLLFKTPATPPTVDVQQLELQKAINVIQSPMPN